MPDCVLIRGHYDNEELPKSVLIRWVRAQGLKEMPKYRVECSDKKFIAVVDVNGKKFMTNVLEKSKKLAEQGAALAFCRHLDLITPKS